MLCRMGTTIDGHAGQQAVAAMLQFGTDVMFTLNGGHIWPLYDAARDQGMRVVDTRHEQTATFAAEAYAKLTRRPGFAALTAGPCITNGVSITSVVQRLTGRGDGVALRAAGDRQEMDHPVAVDHQVGRHQGRNLRRRVHAPLARRRNGMTFYFLLDVSGARAVSCLGDEWRKVLPDDDEVARLPANAIARSSSAATSTDGAGRAPQSSTCGSLLQRLVSTPGPHELPSCAPALPRADLVVVLGTPDFLPPALGAQSPTWSTACAAPCRVPTVRRQRRCGRSRAFGTAPPQDWIAEPGRRGGKRSFRRRV
jgi:hypothetical protein